MYLHLGQDVVIKTKEIIGIFDIEKTSVSKRTKEFLSQSKNHAEIITVSYEMPKSFIITKKDNKEIIYISQISSSTLLKRANLK